MSNQNPRNYAHSCFIRLKNLAKERGYFFNQLLVRYANERFFYRLSVSQYAKQFVLKGGNLFIIWQNGWSFRPTIDSDLLCFGKTDPEYLQTVFAEICGQFFCETDGMEYNVNSIRISSIRKENEYGGIRFLWMHFLAMQESLCNLILVLVML